MNGYPQSRLICHNVLPAPNRFIPKMFGPEGRLIRAAQAGIDIQILIRLWDVNHLWPRLMIISVAGKIIGSAVSPARLGVISKPDTSRAEERRYNVRIIIMNSVMFDVPTGWWLIM